MYLEREKRLKSLVLLVLWVKGVVCPPLWYTLILWGMRVVLPSYCDPLWSTYGPLSYLVVALLLCVPLV